MARMQGGTSNKRQGSAWGGFLVMAFIVLGLCGLFSTYAAQLPYQRALYADARLDAARNAPDALAQLDRLRDALGDDGTGAFDSTGDIANRIAHAHSVLTQHFQQQGGDIALRLRIVLVVFTGAAALFGLMVVSVLRRSAS
ncbi:hypothetical protein [Lichenicoccus sp.]|uniref:hypothetical protein n=1 Tax=Lichenicoccus sp. TaxID=2781899 RepID=UPI003D1010D4